MSQPTKIPVTDELSLCLRAFANAKSNEPFNGDASLDAKSRKRPAASGWQVIFDTETTVGASQSLRFGTYQVRKDTTLRETGIFYEPHALDAGSLRVIESYAAQRGLQQITRDEFVDLIIYQIGWKLRATIIGFNLPFDISRIAIHHNSARGTMRGGFTFKLSEQKIFPNIQVKHLSQRAAFIQFAKPMGQMDSRGMRKRNLRIAPRRGHFVDCKTLAGALFERSFTLDKLSAFLKVPSPKLEVDEFDGPITETLLDYAVRDVQTTWECYAELIKRFERLGLKSPTPDKAYSAASIGKACLREMGIAPWQLMQPDFPKQMLAEIMSAYFGGRSEVRIRREVRQVVLCDFLSMYPAVCTLMGLWRFVIAQGMTWQNSTAETKRFLQTIDVDGLQKQQTWKSLTTLVRVEPDADVFPIRAAYDGEPTATIGLNYLTNSNSQWFTLADCIASKLQTGNVPKVLETVTFQPGPIQSGLKPLNVGGNASYRVDPVSTDGFKRMIEMRQSIKAEMRDAAGSRREALDVEQNALKITTNSTAYGIYVEVNVATITVPVDVTIYNSSSEPFECRTDKQENPGTFFHPLLASLITGAARLMLTLCERLITDQGLDWAFCDTDSMAIAKPEAMSKPCFQRRVDSIVSWFEALNPYDFGGSILKVESVNFGLEKREPVPLYCWAVSSKRYALFNVSLDGTPIMRKVSAHGLGHLLPPYDSKSAPSSIPEPDPSVLSYGVHRWQSDLWFKIVSAALAGEPDQVSLDYHPALTQAACSRYSATSPELLRWFKHFNKGKAYRDQVRPFGFLMALTADTFANMNEAVVVDGPKRRGRPSKKQTIWPITTYAKDRRSSLSRAFDRVTGADVQLDDLASYADVLSGYHLHPESKFLNGDYLDRGATRRRHIEAASTTHIGKESNDWERQAVLGINADSLVNYGVAEAEVIEQLSNLVAEFGMPIAAKALAVSKPKLAAVVENSLTSRAREMLSSLARRLPAARRRCVQQKEECAAELAHLRALVANRGLRATARTQGVDPSNLRRRISRDRSQ